MAPTPATTASPKAHPNEQMFCQNQRDLRAYVAALERGELPGERGLVVGDSRWSSAKRGGAVGPGDPARPLADPHELSQKATATRSPGQHATAP